MTGNKGRTQGERSVAIPEMKAKRQRISTGAAFDRDYRSVV
jgi:hypothetical protein